MRQSVFSRRRFLALTLSSAAWGALPGAIRAGERPPVVNPRATDGDEVHEPNWDERITVTVGPEKADLVGRDDKVLQAAVDYVARYGGGTVRVLPGKYTLRNAVFLPSRIRLVGSGGDSVLTKIASESIPLTEDSDWYDQEITLSRAGDFRVGDGVALLVKDPETGNQEVIKRTLVARSGNRFKLNDGLRKNLWLAGKPTAVSLFPLLTSEYTADVVIENLTLDGNRAHNANFNGNYGGCIFLQDCNRYTIRGVEAAHYNGDGISFQVCHDVVVERCHSHGHAGFGVHPGSGSQRPLLVENRLEDNGIGIYWCWGVKYGLAERNKIAANRDYGISIGHCDTDNVLRDNDVSQSGKVGILFRDDARGKDFWANRNLVENNRVIDSGDDRGIAIDVAGKTKDTRIVNNEIRETRRPMQRTGIRIDVAAGKVELAGNRIEGFAVNVADQRTNS